MKWDPVPWQELQAQVERIASADAAVFTRMRAALKLK